MQTEVKSRILIVDDSPENLLVLMGTLRGNHAIMTAKSGEEALRHAAGNPPDLILLDIMMPHMDGYEVCRRLKDDPKLADIPVVFISALGEAIDKVAAFRAGGVDYVTKPFQPEEVLARVGTQLRLAGLQRQLQQQNENLEQIVAERTGELASRTEELAKAHRDMREVTRLKDDFLSMITHELRTPANGLLGVGEFLIELCPPTEESRELAEDFRQCSQRLLNLLDDVLLLANMERLTAKPDDTIDFTTIMTLVKQELPDVPVALDNLPADSIPPPRVDRSLLVKALKTLFELAACFRWNNDPIRPGVERSDRQIHFVLELNDLTLNSEQLATFFDIESPIRAYSKAERLALAPVVAHRIILAVGGTLEIARTGERTGCLHATLPC